jgi:hypothetical protein
MTLPHPPHVERPQDRGTPWYCEGCGSLLGRIYHGTLYGTCGGVWQGRGKVPCYNPDCDAGWRDWHEEPGAHMADPCDLPEFLRTWYAARVRLTAMLDAPLITDE